MHDTTAVEILSQIVQGALAQLTIGDTMRRQAPEPFIGISYPARMCIDSIQLIRESMITGGIDKNNIAIAIPEPAAAALGMLHSFELFGSIHDAKTILIIDIGGGTFDIR